MKAVILYASVHHGNTRKVAEAIASVLAADLIDVQKTEDFDLSRYDLIGFASGIYYSGIHEAVSRAIEAAEFRPDQRVFTVVTSGAPFGNFSASVTKLLKAKNARVAGSFQCRGFDTYGVFGKLGGIAKGHPNEKDLSDARAFAEKLRDTD